MKLNKSLHNVLLLSERYSDYAHVLINKFLNASPVTSTPENEIKYSNSEISIDSFGDFNGEHGIWTSIVTIDKNNEVSKLRITFRGEGSSNKAYVDTFALTIAGVTPDAPFGLKKRQLVDFTQARIYNYRNFAGTEPITIEDIKSYSTPVTISKFTLNAQRDVRTGKCNISANEKYGTAGQASYLSSENFEELEA